MAAKIEVLHPRRDEVRKISQFVIRPGLAHAVVDGQDPFDAIASHKIISQKAGKPS